MNKPNQTDLVFHALASRVRRLIMDVVKQLPGCCVNDICAHFEMSRIGVMKHLKILVESKLILSRKSGRTRELFFNAAPIQLIYDRWTDDYSAFWITQAIDLKYQAEQKNRRSKKKTAADTKVRRTSKTARKQKRSSVKRKTKVAS